MANYRCADCGTGLPPGAWSCAKCGSERRVQVVQPPIALPATILRCKQCGMFWPQDRQVCAFCQCTESVEAPEPITPKRTSETPRPYLAGNDEPIPADSRWLIAALFTGLILGAFFFLTVRNVLVNAWIYGSFVAIVAGGNVWIVGMISLTKQHAARNGRILAEIERKIAKL